MWMDECCKMFGGLDILSLDAVVDEKGNHTILEVNDTATGNLR
jgi:D-alanine-D-alanine ligase-like ATP-grasp enzyme